MEPEVEERFERIESILHAMAERSNQMELRSRQSEERSIQRFERAERRMELADQRMDKFDKQLQATRKLVETGMKLMVRLTARIDDLARTQQAFLRGLRNGSNGNSRRRSH